jgi:hypothetical protein
VSFREPLPLRLENQDAERVRRSHEECIRELQGLPAAGLTIVKDVALANATLVLVPHRLGRVPSFVACSPPRGASSSGRIEEVRDNVDRSKIAAFKTTGYGATVTVDVVVL